MTNPKNSDTFLPKSNTNILQLNNIGNNLKTLIPYVPLIVSSYFFKIVESSIQTINDFSHSPYFTVIKHGEVKVFLDQAIKDPTLISYIPSISFSNILMNSNPTKSFLSVICWTTDNKYHEAPNHLMLKNLVDVFIYNPVGRTIDEGRYKFINCCKRAFVIGDNFSKILKNGINCTTEEYVKQCRINEQREEGWGLRLETKLVQDCPPAYSEQFYKTDGYIPNNANSLSNPISFLFNMIFQMISPEIKDNDDSGNFDILKFMFQFTLILFVAYNIKLTLPKMVKILKNIVTSNVKNNDLFTQEDENDDDITPDMTYALIHMFDETHTLGSSD
jgi:hypothetical protein